MALCVCLVAALTQSPRSFSSPIDPHGLRSRAGVLIGVTESAGGGKVPALARSLQGRSRVARTLVKGMIRLGARLPGVTWRPVEVNGSPGALFLDGHQQLIGVMALDITDGQITSVSSILNPDKLAHLGPVADLRSLLQMEEN
jgi:RNA polymerase sigma-70 factor (ECF subfamily)